MVEHVSGTVQAIHVTSDGFTFRSYDEGDIIDFLPCQCFSRLLDIKERRSVAICTSNLPLYSTVCSKVPHTGDIMSCMCGAQAVRLPRL